jgi:hypothetical protein
VIAAVILAAAALAVGWLAWTARLIHVANLDAQALMDKLATPEPVSALDWPELQVRAVVPLPDDQPLVLLLVGWPAHPEREVTLLLALDGNDHQSVPVLGQWCATHASVSPSRHGGAELELRRRRSLERVHAALVAEDRAPVLPA